MRFRFSHVKLIFISFFVILFLSAGFFYLWRFVGIPEVYFEEIILGLGFFAIALITVVFYQSVRIYESASSMAENITQDILSYSHELFTELYRSSPVPYIVIDSEGRVDSMNIATARLFHTELNALEGINIFSFFEDDEHHKASLIPEYFKEGKSVSDVELELHRPDGLKRWVLLSLFSFNDTNHKQKGLLTLVDITKQKMIDKAKTEFVSLASHQLRTPISSMKWNIELLLSAGKDTLGDLQKTYIAKITTGVERMEALINDFLSVSKFELGTLAPEYSDINLQEFLQKVCDEQEPIAKNKGVRIETHFGEAIGTIHSDKDMLHNIVSNLLGNAVKYTPSGGVAKLKAARKDGRITIMVTDTGIGIPKEDQDMIFSKLFRASNARSRVADGTGLGLYIVKQAVTVLGGNISFVSEEESGTEFTVVLPA